MVNKKAFPKVAKAIRFTKEELEFLASVNANLTKAVQECIRAKERESMATTDTPPIVEPDGDGGAGAKPGDPF